MAQACNSHLAIDLATHPDTHIETQHSTRVICSDLTDYRVSCASTNKSLTASFGMNPADTMSEGMDPDNIQQGMLIVGHRDSSLATSGSDDWV